MIIPRTTLKFELIIGIRGLFVKPSCEVRMEGRQAEQGAMGNHRKDGGWNEESESQMRGRLAENQLMTEGGLEEKIYPVQLGGYMYQRELPVRYLEEIKNVMSSEPDLFAA